jgi:hypothetical protein
LGLDSKGLGVKEEHLTADVLGSCILSGEGWAMRASRPVSGKKQSAKNSFPTGAAMGSVAKMAADPQAAVLQALQQREYLPIELLKSLQDEQRLSLPSIKAAILDLLREMKIEFGPDQKLRIRVAAHSVAG